ncbi:MAG: methyltransferase, TIGR04290 family [Bdellovibrionales bacterium RIFOXYC1_FULL_54_43]|nr:MAG: methyltransferase, TIGR04290 family [Bdellovibrionales bacterium RIFOXYC1_FULL_54_43]OFZ80628.1 MAG: methyltransferase, TIGR04290 family [Bdellovibrionales bacterium RIFOXYD1_FULL_55_31]
MQNIPQSVAKSIKRLGPWFHNIHLPSGHQTAPEHFLGDFPSSKWRQIQSRIPRNLKGWTCLDIGCNAGFYSYELAKRGANVLGIDSDNHYLAQAKWIAKEFHPENAPHFEKMQIHDLSRLNQKFDLILFMGVFYHLRYPALALDTVSMHVRKLMVFQTLTMAGDEVVKPRRDYGLHERHYFDASGWPKMAFIEHAVAGDDTNWWVPNHSAVLAMLRSTGFRKIERVAHEIYLCQPEKRGARGREWDLDEWKAATGHGRTRGSCHD